MRKERQKKDELGHLSPREEKVTETRTMVKLSRAAQQCTMSTFLPTTAEKRLIPAL